MTTRVGRYASVVLALVALTLPACDRDDVSRTGVEATAAETPAESPQPTATPDPPLTLAREVKQTVETAPTNQYAAVAAGSLWLPNPETGHVSRVDLASGRIVDRFKVGRPTTPGPADVQAIAASGKSVWVTQTLQRAVVRINPVNNTILDRIRIGAQPYALALNRRTLWATDFENGGVVRVDTRNKEVVARIRKVSNPTGIAVGGGAVWVAEHRLGRLVRIDPQTNRVVKRIDIGGNPENVAVGFGSAWVATNAAQSVARVAFATNKAVSIPLEMQVFGVAVDDAGVWAAGGTEAAGLVAQIDPTSNTVSGETATNCAYGVVSARQHIWAVSDLGCIARIVPRI